MISNEQRAHDIALATAKLFAEQQFELALRSPKANIEITTDIYPFLPFLLFLIIKINVIHTKQVTHIG